MKGAEFIEKINEIDADLIQDAARGKARKINYVKAALLVAACLVMAVGGAFGIRALMKNNDVPCEAGGTDGKLNVTAPIVLTGTDDALSVEEARAFLEGAGGTAIRNELAASGVKTDNLHFSTWGVSILRSGDKGNSMAVDWREFLAYSGDELVAVIDLNKQSDGIHHGIAFGGPWFPKYQAFLTAHAGEELVMIYAGDVQAIVAPDNRIYSLSGESDGFLTENIEEGKDYYHYFKQEQNTFVP